MNTKIAILSGILALGLSAGFAVAAPLAPQPQVISPPPQLAVQPSPINAYTRAAVIGMPGPYNLGDGYVNQRGFPLGGWNQLTSPQE
jgi:hypothetical protein